MSQQHILAELLSRAYLTIVEVESKVEEGLEGTTTSLMANEGEEEHE